MTEHRRPASSVRPGFARDDWNARYAQKELLWTAEPNRCFAAEVEGLGPGRALDVACGEGRNAVWLAERGWRVTGVDFSDVAIEKAAALATARGVEVDWVVDDVVAYAPEPGAFDLVAVLYLQLPRDELAAALHGAARAVAPGGTIVVLGHDSTNLTDGYGGPKDPAVLFTPEDVVEELGDLVVERAEKVPRKVPLDDGEAVAVDALVRARRPETRVGGVEYARHMHTKTVELTDEELTLLHAAVRSYLDDFGHEEADLLRRVKQLLAKLEAVQAD